uniref:Uncharacterized protein n=1 Tax=Vespula pensylvanica TaxID=30213 RepID=A0A834UG93_VESPE|nr:hypothetical protein H0235_000877 [Vespula pensylvanica]
MGWGEWVVKEERGYKGVDPDTEKRSFNDAYKPPLRELERDSKFQAHRRIRIIEDLFPVSDKGGWRRLPLT